MNANVGVGGERASDGAHLRSPFSPCPYEPRPALFDSKRISEHDLDAPPSGRRAPPGRAVAVVRSRVRWARTPGQLDHLVLKALDVDLQYVDAVDRVRCCVIIESRRLDLDRMDIPRRVDFSERIVTSRLVNKELGGTVAITDGQLFDRNIAGIVATRAACRWQYLSDTRARCSGSGSLLPEQSPAATRRANHCSARLIPLSGTRRRRSDEPATWDPVAQLQHPRHRIRNETHPELKHRLDRVARGGASSVVGAPAVGS